MARPNWTSFGDGNVLSARGLRGMLRTASIVLLPAQIARTAYNVRFKQGLVKRRLGAVCRGTAPAQAQGSIVFDGVTTQYITVPDNAVYDLGTKWAIVLWVKSNGVAAVQYILSRDVTPTSAGKKTFAVYQDANRRLGFEMHDSAGTSFTLAPSAATDISDGLLHAVVIARDGATLSMYMDGDPTPKVTRTDLVAANSNIAGATKIGIGLTSNDNYVANFTNKFAGSVGMVMIFRFYTTVADILRWTTYRKYPNPKDPHVALALFFNYTKETGTTAKDWSLLENDGTLVGAPVRGAELGVPTLRVQHVSPYMTNTGLSQNLAFIGGDLYVTGVRTGR